MFYTYAHYTEDTNTPFYVGKGQKKRHCSLKNRNKWWNNVVKKHGFTSIVLTYWKTEEEAFEHEKFLIKCFKSLNVNLVNLTEGGEGCSGLKRTEASKEKARLSNTGKIFSEERKKNIATALTGRSLSPEHAEKSRKLLKAQTEKQKKKVFCVTTGASYLSVTEASQVTGVDASSIVKACKQKLKQAGGYVWKYQE